MTLQERLAMRQELMGYDPVISLEEYVEETEETVEPIEESYSGKVPFWKKENLEEASKSIETTRSSTVKQGLGIGGGIGLAHGLLSPASSKAERIGKGVIGLAKGAGIGALAGEVASRFQGPESRQADLKRALKTAKENENSKKIKELKTKLSSHKQYYGNLTKNENINLTENTSETNFSNSRKVNIAKGKYKII